MLFGSIPRCLGDHSVSRGRDGPLTALRIFVLTLIEDAPCKGGFALAIAYGHVLVFVASSDDLILTTHVLLLEQSLLLILFQPCSSAFSSPP
jgi:hypothetical protein